MAKQKKQMSDDGSQPSGEIMPDAVLEILASLLANPNYFPKHSREIAIEEAKRIVDMVSSEK